MTCERKIGPYDCCSVVEGDCLELMKALPDGCVDAVITSPPYNMRTRIRNGKYVEREIAQHFSRKYEHFADALSPEEYYRFHGAVLREYIRIASIAVVNIQVVTGSKASWFRLIGDFREFLKDVAVWDKGEGQPAMHAAIMNRGYELVLLFDSSGTAGREFKKCHFARGEMPDIWRFGRGGNGSIEGHAAPFPIELPTFAAKGWTDDADTILDPFCGSGTTLVASKKLGRHFLGFEISPEYCAIARRRLAEIDAQPSLFAPKPEQLTL